MKDIFKELKINKSNIYNFILSIVSYTGIILYYGINNNLNFSIFFLLGYFFLLYIFINKNEEIDKKNKRFSFILGLFLTVITVIGNTVNKYIYSDIRMIFDLKNIFLAFLEIICLFPLSYRLLNMLFYYSNKISLNVKNERNYGNKFFFFSWILIFISYLPYFLRYFPGKMTLDSNVQMDIIKNKIFSDWHPFIQTQFVGLFYNIGNVIFKDENIAISLYTIVQMFLMSCLFAYACKFLYKRKTDIKVCLIILLCYALLPLYTHYSVTIWKDIIFGGSFILIFISLIEFADSNFNLKQIVLFTLGLLIMLFFRNNGIYIVLFMTPFILFKFKNKYKIFLPLMIVLISFYYVIKIPVYNKLGVEKSSSVEALSIPLQQIGRVFALEKSVDLKSLEYLNSIMDTEKVKNEYLPYISDPIKNLVNREKLEDDKKSFIETWLRLLKKHPQIYIEAYLSQTVGYFFTDSDYWVTINTPKNINIPEVLVKAIDYTSSKKVPLSNIFWSIGLGFIVTLLSFSISYYKKNKYLITYIPFLGLWLTMIVASPVYCEFRYVYGLFTCLPLILILPFLSKQNNLKSEG